MLVDRFGERPFLIAGPLLQAVGMGWIALVADAGMAYVRADPAADRRRASAISMTFPAAQNSVVGSVPPEAIGKASGTNSTMRELGGVLGIALASPLSPAPAATPRRRRSPTASSPRWACQPACRCSARSPARRSAAMHAMS